MDISEIQEKKAFGSEKESASSLGNRVFKKKRPYEIEVERIRKSFGDLEPIRLRLGLTRRKMAQLLMVDPSAWTRWTRSEQGAPPHIYRALEWYLLLKEKSPEKAHSYWLATVGMGASTEKEVRALRQEAEGLKKSLRALEGRVSSPRQVKIGLWALICGVLLAGVMGWLMASAKMGL